jgi:hypothetical protein
MRKIGVSEASFVVTRFQASNPIFEVKWNPQKLRGDSHCDAQIFGFKVILAPSGPRGWAVPFPASLTCNTARAQRQEQGRAKQLVSLDL